MTPRQIEDYLQDILDAISAAQQFTAGMSFENGVLSSRRLPTSC